MGSSGQHSNLGVPLSFPGGTVGHLPSGGAGLCCLRPHKASHVSGVCSQVTQGADNCVPPHVQPVCPQVSELTPAHRQHSHKGLARRGPTSPHRVLSVSARLCEKQPRCHCAYSCGDPTPCCSEVCPCGKGWSCGQLRVAPLPPSQSPLPHQELQRRKQTHWLRELSTEDPTPQLRVKRGPIRGGGLGGRQLSGHTGFGTFSHLNPHSSICSVPTHQPKQWAQLVARKCPG